MGPALSAVSAARCFGYINRGPQGRRQNPSAAVEIRGLHRAANSMCLSCAKKRRLLSWALMWREANGYALWSRVITVRNRLDGRATFRIPVVEDLAQRFIADVDFVCDQNPIPSDPS
jgi:hypothetical protein